MTGARLAEACEALEERVERGRPGPWRNRDLVVAQKHRHITELQRRGRLVSEPITPQNEFPRFLTRLPVFMPGRRKEQKERLDEDNALVFTTSWGSGKRFGPPLTVYDEDTLIALCRLRQLKLEGEGPNLPIPLSRRGEVHALYCRIGEIQKECGCTAGGRNNKLRIASIKRLAGTRIQLDRSASKNLGVATGTTISLIDAMWEHYEDDAIIYVQFPPAIARELETAYVWLNWEVRRRLSDTGKALHRFLSSQPRHYRIGCKKLRTTIGYQREYRSFMRDLRRTLKRLVDLEWMSSYDIEGNGRNRPHTVSISR